MKKIISTLIALTMIFSSFASFAENAAEKISFIDVNPETETGKAIMKLAEAGIVNGNGDGTFTPKRCVTRAELCKMINNIKNYTEEDLTSFSDVTTDKWYYSHVKIAKKAGYINGFEDGTFRGEEYVTREQACAILVRVLGLYDLGLPVTISDAVSPWAENYVKTVVSNTLMKLEEGNLFRATEAMTREELSVPLANFVIVTPEDVIVPDDKKDTEKDDKKEENKDAVSTGGSSSGGSSSNKDNKDDEEDEGESGFAPDDGEDGGIEEEVFDEAKQNEIVEKLGKLLEELDYIATLPWVEFTDSENEILVIIKDVVGKTLKDAQDGKWIYVEDYVLKTYNSEVMTTRSMYKALEEKGEAEAFKDKLGELPLYLIEYLADTMFGVDIKQHI